VGEMKKWQEVSNWGQLGNVPDNFLYQKIKIDYRRLLAHRITNSLKILTKV
jgi:hypothetical protein